MKNIKEYIKESLLDDEEDLIDNPAIQVSEWLNRHKILYGIENGKVNNDGTIDANVVRINNFVDEDLIPDYVQFNNVKSFVITGCSGLKNCKGFPKKCNYFRLQNCVNLETLEGFPKGAKYDVFSLRYDSGYYHHKLKSYKGMPDADIVSIDGLKFKNLNGMGDTKELAIQYCDDLIKLNPPKSTKDLTILYCRKLKDLSKMHKMDQIIVENCNLPKEIFAKFTENLQYS